MRNEKKKVTVSPRKRRKTELTIKSFFVPNHNEDPCAPPVRNISQNSCKVNPTTLVSQIDNGTTNNSVALISTNIKNKSPLLALKKKQQLYLDFGQKSFGKRTLCPICNMLYVNGLEEDEVQHSKICQQYKLGVSYHGFKRERLIQMCEDGEKIIEIRSTDPPRHLMKVSQVKTIVEKDMSFTSNNSKLPDLTYYLYISSKKTIVGFLSVHPLSEAYPVISYDINMRSQIPKKVTMGIYLIWTLKSNRRKGIANKLVDAARERFVYGMRVEKEKIAFSSPTEHGMQFAKKYIGIEKKVLVYDC